METDRQQSGSVSPPAPPLLSMESMNGKKAFYETMRKRYADGRTPPEDLEKKIEQLWKGLSQTQKEQFILKSTNGSRANIPSISPEKKPKPRIIRSHVREAMRSDTCKAIATVLDLQGDTQNSRFADTVKKRMKAYTNEACLITGVPPPQNPLNQRKTTFRASADRLQQAADSVKLMRMPKIEVKKEIEAFEASGAIPTSSALLGPKEVPKVLFRTPISAERREKLSSVISRVVSNHQKSYIPPNRFPVYSGATPTSSAPSAIRVFRPKMVSRPRPMVRPVPTVPQIPYEDVCRQYYSMLTNATLKDSVVDPSLPKLAQIVEGWHVAREYTFSDRL